jgi:hypothetical protein
VVEVIQWALLALVGFGGAVLIGLAMTLRGSEISRGTLRGDVCSTAAVREQMLRSS